MNKIHRFLIYGVVPLLFMAMTAQGQTCDFTLDNSATAGAGQNEVYIEVDAAGIVLQVFTGTGPHTLNGVATGSATTVHHLIWDTANSPANVPPAVNDDVANITGGCTNDFLGAALTVACLCEEDAIDGVYTPGGGDMLVYFLTDDSGVILDSNGTGNFGTDEAIGDYFVYSLAYDSTNPPSTIPVIGGNISGFSEDGCYNADFLSNLCCAQKINCCDFEATVDTANPTCTGPGGDLQFAVTVTGATGTVTATPSGTSTATDNGGGSWTITIAPGSADMVLFGDSAAPNCDVTLAVDATFLACDDASTPICSFTATLDPTSFICDATDGTTVTGQIVVVGAVGTNVTIDGVTVGGDGTYSTTQSLLTTGTIVVIDPNGLIQPCQVVLNYDLTDLTCDGQNPGDPPLPSGDCNLSVILDQNSLMCQADGTVNGTVNITGVIDGMLDLDGTVIGGNGTYTINFPTDAITNFTYTDLSYTGSDPLVCQTVLSVDLTGFTCDDVDIGDPPIPICTFTAALDAGGPTCSAPNGNLEYTVNVGGIIGTVTANFAGAIDNNDGTWTISIAPGTAATVIFSDDLGIGYNDCTSTITVDATYLICDDLGNPTCSMMATLDPASFVCDATDGTTVTGQIVVTGAVGTNVTIDGVTVGGDGTYSITQTLLTTGTIVVVDPDGLIQPCEVVLNYDLTDLTCDGVDPGNPPIPSGVCTFMANLDSDSFACQTDGTISANIIVTNAIDGMISIDGVVVGGDGTYSVNFAANTLTTFTLVDESYTGADPPTCEIMIPVEMTGLTCNTVDPGDPPILLIDLTAFDPCVCNNDQTANGSADGTFSEIVTIQGLPGLTLCAGSNSTGLIGVGLPAAFTETPAGSGNYEIGFNHLDALGYTLEFVDCSGGGEIPLVVNLLGGGTAGSITNTCYYPIIEFDPFSGICDDEPLYDLSTTANLTNDNPGGLGTFGGGFIFSGTGVTDPNFDPATGVGTYNLTATYTPANAVGTNVNPADDVCTTSMDATIQVYNLGPYEIDRVCQGNALYVLSGTTALPNDPNLTYNWYQVVGQVDFSSGESDDVLAASIVGQPYFSPTATGSYWVEVILESGCLVQVDDDGMEITEIIDCSDCGN